jgi:hypothetical protein
MFRHPITFVKRLSHGRAACCALLAIGLGLGGCQGPNLRGDPFPSDDLGRFSGQLRSSDPAFRPQTWSNQAREIERNLSGDINHGTLLGR